MGAWGVLAFDNDDANDWAYDLEETTDLSLIESTFAMVEEAEDYLEAPEACHALAACEVLARLKGNFGYQNAYTEKVDVWVANHPNQPSPEMLARASAILDRVTGEDSELKDLWEEGNATDWQQSLEDLRRRLKS
jgi:hypothetical protein